MELIDTPALLTKSTSPSSRCTPVMKTSSKARMYKSSRVWLKKYLENVQRRQEMRQNHVHVWNEKKKCKMPLTHCQCSDDASKCKAGFPRKNGSLINLYCCAKVFSRTMVCRILEEKHDRCSTRTYERRKLEWMYGTNISWLSRLELQQ